MSDTHADRLSSPPLADTRRLSALDTVRVRIAMAVELGLLKPGDRLPDAGAVAAALDVGEITVRRGLVALTDSGVLTRRRGRDGGTYVAADPPRGAVAEMDAYSSAAGGVHELIDRRLIIETGVVTAAAGVAAPAELDALDQLVDAMDAAQSWADFHCRDKEFHLAVARATGLTAATALLRDALRELYPYYLPYPMAYLRKSNDEHRALVRALRANDAAAAARVIHAHVHCLHQTMFVGLL